MQRRLGAQLVGSGQRGEGMKTPARGPEQCEVRPTYVVGVDWSGELGAWLGWLVRVGVKGMDGNLGWDGG